MLSKIRNAVGLALVLALTTFVGVLAKGGFSFIAITGAGIEEEVRSSDLGLTEDFFAFADFYRDKVDAPMDPGQGYEITRYYIDGKREIAFDQLHYYPETGYVFYDGIVNGDSEYDGEWYTANPTIQPLFESVLAATVSAGVQPVTQAEEQPSAAEPAKEMQPAASAGKSQPAASSFPSTAMMPVAILAGMGLLFWFAIRLRKPSVQ